MKKRNFALLAAVLSVSAAFAETPQNAVQLLDVVLGDTATEEQAQCVAEKMAECDNVGLPVDGPEPTTAPVADDAAVDAEKTPTVARRRFNRSGMKSTGKNETVKLALNAVPLSEIQQLNKCVTNVMTKCSVTDYQINIIEETVDATEEAVPAADAASAAAARDDVATNADGATAVSDVPESDIDMDTLIDTLVETE